MSSDMTDKKKFYHKKRENDVIDGSAVDAENSNRTSSNRSSDAKQLSPEEKIQQERQLRELLSALAAKKGNQEAPQQPSKELSFVDKVKGLRKYSLKQILIMSVNKIFAAMAGGVHYLDRFVNFVVKPTDPNRNEVIAFARPPILFGAYIIVVFVVFGGLWASFAPLDSAAHAMGRVIASSNRKIIQHPDGGVIKSILVKQGDHVKKGDTLLILNNTKHLAEYEIILSSYRQYAAMEARFIAERDQLDEISFPDIVLDGKDIDEVEKMIQTQNNVFQSRKQVLNAKIEMHNNSIDQYTKQIESLNTRHKYHSKSLKYLSERIESSKKLQKQGFDSKAHLLELKDRKSSIKAGIADDNMQISRLKEEISKSKLAIAHEKSSHLTEVLSHLRDVSAKKNEYRERYIEYQDIIRRTHIQSPVDGFVIDVMYHTIGGVVHPGHEVAQIAPEKDPLIIEAHIDPKEISSIVEGQEAKIKFLAFKSRTSPTFTGTVMSISPDLVVDRASRERGGQGYYVAKIQIHMDEFNKIAKRYNLKLVQGMQTDIQIIRGTRTLLRYLLDPVLDQMFKSLIER